MSARTYRNVMRTIYTSTVLLAMAPGLWMFFSIYALGRAPF